MSPLTIPVEYVEHAPLPSLRGDIECFWTRGVAPGVPRQSTHLVLPDGAIDVILSVHDGIAVGSMAVGTMTRAITVHGATTAYIGARFRAGRAAALLGVPASALTDLAVPLTALGRRAACDLHTIAEADRMTSGRSDLAAVLDAFAAALETRLRAVPAAPRAVDAAVAAIVRAGGALPLSPLAPALGLTRQHLAREFARHVGVSPKTFARVVRMRRVLALARAAARVDWSRLALEAGYYDQAHLTTELRELTGRTPGEWF